MSDNEMSKDGLRRYEELLKEIRAIAEQALGIAMTHTITGTGGVLPIENGGTGSSVKNFVDLSSNQFNIAGSKIFTDSCGFQNRSDIVDSGELAGNIRLISCDSPGADVGPQLRFSGRSSVSDSTPFAFATIAGRKENETDGDKAGYLQFSTTNSEGHIIEHGRLTSGGVFIFGNIPLELEENRLHISGGDIFIDNLGGDRSLKIQLSDALARLQALRNPSSGGTTDSEDVFLSVNVRFQAGGVCLLDNLGSGGSSVTRGSSAIQLSTAGFIRFLTGNPNECPVARGQFTEDGLEIYGSLIATNNIIAGGLDNAVGGIGNHTAVPDGFVTGDNVKYGPGSPEGIVYAPVGAIYGRSSGDPSGSDMPSSNEVLWVKTTGDGENTGWLPVPVGSAGSIVIQDACPDIPPAGSSGTDAPAGTLLWFDSKRKLWFYYDASVVRNADVDPPAKGAWLSTQLFQLVTSVTGRDHTEQFAGDIDKDYEYLTPIHVTRNNLDMFLVDMTAAIRVSLNSWDPTYALHNYYTFDLVALNKRQGAPSRDRAIRQEWPGDREAYEIVADDFHGDGHTLFTNLRTDLVALSSLTPDGPPVDGTGSVTSVGTNRRVLIDATKTWDAAGLGQWGERENDDVRNGYPQNNGFRVTMIDGPLAGQSRIIYRNTATTLVLRRPWRKVGSIDRPQTGDHYIILDSQDHKVIARISTKGNIWPNGAHVDPSGDPNDDPPPLFEPYKYDDSGALLTKAQVKRNGRFLTQDVQDFVTSITNGLDENQPGGDPDPDAQHIQLDQYINVSEGVHDAVVLAGLWDMVRRPGKITGVISITYRLALSPSICAESGASVL